MRGLDPTPSPLLCCFQLGKNGMEKWEPGARREQQDEPRHHPLRLRRNEKRRAEKRAASGMHPGFVRCLSGVAFDLGSMVVRAGQR